MPSNAQRHDIALRVGSRPLSIDDVVSVAREKHAVVLDKQALAQVAKAHEALTSVLEHGVPVYGVTRGVGQNADRRLLPDGAASTWTAFRQQSQQLNKTLLLSHAASVGELLSAEEVRAALLVRLNGLMHGRTGCRPEVCQFLLKLLQSDQLPPIREFGSVGQADIVQGAAIGIELMAMGGSSAGRLEASRLEGRDALALVSTNAISVGQACLRLHDAGRLLKSAEAVWLCSLNGINGNTSPFQPRVVQHQSPRLSSARTAYYEHALAGSFLESPSEDRKLQDPLSFRCAPHVFELSELALARSKASITSFLSSVEDNPLVLCDEESCDAVLEAGREDLASRALGQVIPNANFCPLGVTLELSSLSSMLGHIGTLSAQRTLRLAEPQHTRLSRFLAADGASFGFCAIQKVSVSLDAELRKESSPPLFDGLAMADGVEDFSTHMPLLLRSLQRQLIIVRQLLALELLHACQAMSLRRQIDTSLSFGTLAGEVLRRVRAVVPIYEDDRALTHDIEEVANIVDTLAIVNLAARGCV